MGVAVQQMFAAIARHYDLLNTLLSFGFHHRWRRRVVTLSHFPVTARLLDICSGTADLALVLARHLGTHGHVIATDFCPAMLTRGQQKAQRAGLAVPMALANAQHLPFADAMFDGVTVAFGLRNVDDLATALQEMYRVLRPGGIAVVLEFGQPQGALFGPVYRLYARYILPRLGAWISGHPEAYTYLPRTAAQFPAGGRFVRAMTAEHFTDVQAHALTGGIVYLYRAIRPPLEGQ